MESYFVLYWETLQTVVMNQQVYTLVIGPQCLLNLAYNYNMIAYLKFDYRVSDNLFCRALLVAVTLV